MNAYSLLAYCARAECNAAHYHHLAQEASSFTEWETVPAQAEAHGMAPLLYTHIKKAGVQLPLAVRRELQGLYLRHREINRVRTRVLREILTAYDAVGIPVLILKGAALSHMLYPEPGLRPMSDVDILVPKSLVWQAQSALAEVGFHVVLPSDSALHHRHLATVVLHTDGLSIKVETHYKLFSDYFDNVISRARSMTLPILKPITQARAFWQDRILSRWLPQIEQEHDNPASMALDGPTGPPYPFALGDLTAYTLNNEDMLWHLCQHLISHVNVWDFGRLIWVADVVSFAERFASEIDWERIRRRCPAILNTLSLLHFMTPLSDELLSKAPIEIGHAPRQIGMEYQGWPKVQPVRWREGGYRHVLCATLFPSEWWLRLRYKLGSTHSLFWCRWVRHPLHILGHIVRVLLERMGWPSPRELAR
jgi:hypothetical protein